jgi:hypothetical protein
LVRKKSLIRMQSEDATTVWEEIADQNAERGRYDGLRGGSAHTISASLRPQAIVAGDE